jgi:hypothetical protein
MSKIYSDRCVFLRCEGKTYKLLTLTQGNQGDIYISFQNFSKIKWLGIYPSEKDLQLAMLESTENEGKLTFHKLGRAGFRAHNTPGHKHPVEGNYLFDRENNKAGVKHLVSIFMDEPKEIPVSGFPMRESDFYIENSGTLKPFVMILFAIPKVQDIKSVAFEFSFSIDELESVPPPDTGMGLIALKYHSIKWFVYRTKYMDKWPKQSYICYHDGYYVPIYVGKAQNENFGELRFDLHIPRYEAIEKELKITL